MPDKNPTSQEMVTLGGTRTYTNFSGVVGPDVLVWSGAGRLDAGFMHDSALLALSGQAIVIYDSSVAVSGGPLATSGHKVVGVLAPSAEFSATGISGAALRGGNVRQFGLPFSSGLVVSTRSGQPGITITFSPTNGG